VVVPRATEYLTCAGPRYHFHCGTSTRKRVIFRTMPLVPFATPHAKFTFRVNITRAPIFRNNCFGAWPGTSISRRAAGGIPVDCNDKSAGSPSCLCETHLKQEALTSSVALSQEILSKHIELIWLTISFFNARRTPSVRNHR
jgi:hypothetical protein